MTSRTLMALLAATLLCSCSRLQPTQPKRTKGGKPFYIAIVGDGVETDEPIVRDHPLNNAQGRAMWKGAEAAFYKSPHTKELRDSVEIKGYDDGGSTTVARNIARRISSTSEVLAVIGHATSGTTRIAASFYAEAGIPLLMPIATSPYAVKKLGDDAETTPRLPNCFRLPLSDVPYQAAMVAHTALEILKTERCYLLRDISEDAADYSGPLYSKLEVLLGPAVQAKRRVNREQTNIPFITESILGYNVDLIIFSGYGTTAQELLHALRVTYQNRKAKRPRVLLTDGCKTQEVDPTGFEVYVTFPAPDVYSAAFSGTDSEDLRILRAASSTSGQQSYEMYGYDAILLLAHAFVQCAPTAISRECIAEALRRRPLDAFGAVFPYEFADGDNTKADYSLYTSFASPTRRFVFKQTVSSADLRKFYDSLYESRRKQP
jgi:ABC-type branched-subunit amino acid transport system substrate-binding protein